MAIGHPVIERVEPWVLLTKKRIDRAEGFFE